MTQSSPIIKFPDYNSIVCALFKLNNEPIIMAKFFPLLKNAEGETFSPDNYVRFYLKSISTFSGQIQKPRQITIKDVNDLFPDITELITSDPTFKSNAQTLFNLHAE